MLARVARCLPLAHTALLGALADRCWRDGHPWWAVPQVVLVALIMWDWSRRLEDR